ncbi:hypothetical protein PIB30_089513 [Stylosanthes scabra]|uniref:Secreted protein n=1 Tax=Stylosanthes scabra TaxID=79078 RepID=A0ABU6XTE4_9FABA|nr:hypothetical protein [Stylosanthes scabra]
MSRFLHASAWLKRDIQRPNHTWLTFLALLTTWSKHLSNATFSCPSLLQPRRVAGRERTTATKKNIMLAGHEARPNDSGTPTVNRTLAMAAETRVGLWLAWIGENE